MGKEKEHALILLCIFFPKYYMVLKPTAISKNYKSVTESGDGIDGCRFLIYSNATCMILHTFQEQL